jgi:hypothetical protein
MRRKGQGRDAGREEAARICSALLQANKTVRRSSAESARCRGAEQSYQIGESGGRAAYPWPDDESPRHLCRIRRDTGHCHLVWLPSVRNNVNCRPETITSTLRVLVRIFDQRMVHCPKEYLCACLELQHCTYEYFDVDSERRNKSLQLKFRFTVLCQLRA